MDARVVTCCFESMTPEQQLQHLEAVARRGLPAWGISSDVELSLLSLSENATWRVVVSDSEMPLILRVHRTDYHDRDAIRSELSWMTALEQDEGIRTPQAIVGHDGEYIQQVETPELGEMRYLVLFHFISGDAPDESSLIEPFKRLGAITARMHRHARDWKRPPFFKRLVWDFDGCIGSVQNWGDWRDGPGLDELGRTLLEVAQAVIERRLSDFGQGCDRFGLIHSDLRLANLLEVDNDTRVIDFDDAGLGWFLYDLASAVSFIETRPDLPQLIDAWVEGYRREGELSAAEEAEIPTFILLRRLTLLAWVASHPETELAQSQGEEFTRGTVQLAQAYLDRMGEAA